MDGVRNMSEEDVKKSENSKRKNPRWTKKMITAASMKIPQNKILIHMYLDKDIIDFFKLEGRGYQTRINSVLKSYIQKKS